MAPLAHLLKCNEKLTMNVSQKAQYPSLLSFLAFVLLCCNSRSGFFLSCIRSHVSLYHFLLFGDVKFRCSVRQYEDWRQKIVLRRNGKKRGRLWDWMWHNLIFVPWQSAVFEKRSQCAHAEKRCKRITLKQPFFWLIFRVMAGLVCVEGKSSKAVVKDTVNQQRYVA